MAHLSHVARIMQTAPNIAAPVVIALKSESVRDTKKFIINPPPREYITEKTAIQALKDRLVSNITLGREVQQDRSKHTTIVKLDNRAK